MKKVNNLLSGFLAVISFFIYFCGELHFPITSDPQGSFDMLTAT